MHVTHVSASKAEYNNFVHWKNTESPIIIVGTGATITYCSLFLVTTLPSKTTGNMKYPRLESMDNYEPYFNN